MKTMGTAAGVLLLSTVTLTGQGPASVPTPPATTERLPPLTVPFVENCGQWDARVAFAARTRGGVEFVTTTG